MPFTMQNWTIAGEWIEPMTQVTCLGATFHAHLMDSMNVLVSSIGEPLRTQANLLTNVNAPVASFAFSGADMVEYLKDGNFKFGTTPADILVIHGPDEGMLLENLNGQAPIGGNMIRINYLKYVIMVQNNLNGWFPANNVGLQNLKTLLGKLVLHEMLHCEGFRHPTHPRTAYDASATYWRTFPEVAEEAYNRLRGGLPNGAFQLVDSAQKSHCGTNN